MLTPYYLIIIFMFTIQKVVINQGQMLLDIYMWGLEQKTIFINGKITASHYKNLVTLPLKLGNIALGKNYLISLKEHINPNHKIEAFRYCQGAFYYYTKEFRQALRHWAQEKFQGFFYEVNSRIMSWEMLYESNEKRHSNELEEKELIISLQKLTSYIIGLEKIADQKKSVYGNRLQFI